MYSMYGETPGFSLHMGFPASKSNQVGGGISSDRAESSALSPDTSSYLIQSRASLFGTIHGTRYRFFKAPPVFRIRFPNTSSHAARALIHTIYGHWEKTSHFLQAILAIWNSTFCRLWGRFGVDLRILVRGNPYELHCTQH